MKTPGDVRRVLLVGFMASGKSSAGRAAAERLGWSFVDFDEEIERRTGSPVDEIFAERGESYFRSVEASVSDELLHLHDTVLAPGGGWCIQRGAWERVPDGTLSVWLRVSPDAAVRRASLDPHARPLLGSEDPAARARELIRERELSYARADVQIDTDSLDVDAVANRIVALIEGPENER